MRNFHFIFPVALTIVLISHGCSDSACNVCGEYTYNHYEKESVFSDSDIAAMVGSSRVDEFKQRIKSEPSATYVLTLSKPEKLENGQLRGSLHLGIQEKFYGDIIYKGKFITVLNDANTDGMLRIEYRYNDQSKDWEQITFGNDKNILLYKITEGGIVVRDYSSDAAGLASLDEAIFKN